MDTVKTTHLGRDFTLPSHTVSNPATTRPQDYIEPEPKS